MLFREEEIDKREKVASSESIEIRKGISSSLNFEVIDALPNTIKIHNNGVKEVEFTVDEEDHYDDISNIREENEFDHNEDFLQL